MVCRIWFPRVFSNFQTAEQQVLTEHEGSLDERVHELYKAKSELDAK